MTDKNPADLFDPRTVSWVMDSRGLEHLETALRLCERVVIDLETTGLDAHAVRGGLSNGGYPARIVAASLTLPTSESSETDLPPTFVLPLSHPESPWRGQWKTVVTWLVQTMAAVGKPIENHNLKFDLRWLYAHSGEVDLTDLFEWDTQVGSHLLDENESTKLKETVPRLFGIERWDDFDFTKPGAAERAPLIDLGLYAARDTFWTWMLGRRQRSIMFLDDSGEEPVISEEVMDARIGLLAQYCAMPTARTLTQMEQRGLVLDVDAVHSRIAELREEAAEAYAVLVDRYPVDSGSEPSFAPTSRWFKEWAAAAVEAGDLRVTALTPSGVPQWDKAVLTRQARTGSETAQTLLTLRTAGKRLEFLEAWLKVVTPDSTIHTTYHSARVLTGRLSSSDPNMQQVTSNLKPMFVPRPGYLLAELDYSQIELRAAAHIAQCEPMIAAFQRGDDLHQILASTIAEVPLEEVTKDQRQAGKSANFGLLYGMSAEGFREYAETVYGVIFTPEEAEDVRQAFFDQWVGMSDWHDEMIRRARRTGMVVSPLGRVRRLPNIHGDGRAASHAERQAINSPVQSFASDMMQMAAASIHGNLPGTSPVPGVHLVGTVHDSIIAEVPEDDWQRATARCMNRMIDLEPHLKRLGCVLTVPLAVEAVVGTRWGLGDVGIIA